VFGSEGVANVLQLATQAATPHQGEVERDFPVESFSLLLPLILAITILETNGCCRGWGDSDFHSLSALGRKRRPSHHELWISEAECQVAWPLLMFSQRALQANRDAQKVAADVAKGYRRYLQQQREQIAKARTRAVHDLRIADNTYETVEASFQLKNLMRDSAASFEAIQKLEAPTFDQIFKNEELRQEFENLARRLDAPSS
jgi:3'-phosphoadenosine 5'-phosphosulfate sulfotransferase